MTFLQRVVSRAAAIVLLISGTAVGMTVAAPSAFASGTVLFSQPFHDNTVDGPAGSVSLPAAPSGTNAACLSAAGNATANPLASCPSATDPQGSGKLRLTSNALAQEGGVFASTSVPTSQGLDVTFNSYQYGSSATGGDGIAFVLAAVNPADPQTPTTMGQPGGSLGYSAKNATTPGLTDGYLGVGIDAFGNFSNKFEGTGCTDPANIAGPMAGEVVVRGPGNGTVGYCAVQSSAATATSQKLTLRASTRAASVVPVEVVFNPGSASVTTPSGLVVPAGDYDVRFTPVGGTARNMVGALPVVPAGLYPASWVNANGIPKQLAFGWVASTGAAFDFHEIDNVVVTTLNPVPQLAVSQTSYSAATLTPGSPVTYTVAASSSGAAENLPVTVTETLPSGVVPVGASGTGWVCGAPSGQQISCTNSTSPFTSGTITVNGVVTSGTVTPALIQSATSVVASSSDGSPGTSSSAPAGTVPAAPVVIAVTPVNGPAGGGNDVTVTGTNLGGATAIEIGTTAEFAAGTPATVVVCSSPAPGCFTVSSGISLDISAMPAHVAGSVTVKIVSLGISGSGSYTYNPGPALLFPAPPDGEVNVAYSDQLTVTGGTSPYTWSVSNGTLPPGLTLSASTGLLAGTPTTAGTYSFTVKVTDHSGLSDTESVSMTIIAGPSLNFPAPPPGWTHTVYGDTLTESGGTAPFTWSVSSGSLPAGISLSADGNLSGTPTATGTSSFTVQVTDANNQTATEATSITVSAGVSTTFAAPPGAVVNTAYTDTLTATGGTTPYTWSVNAGSLPPGITLTSAGVLTGTPTAAGSYTFSVNVVDANNGIATTSITLVVAATLSLSFPAPPSGTVGTAYTDTLTATGGTTPYSWSVSAGTLPAGITLNASTGVLAGTPTVAGTSSFTIKVTDASSQAATEATSITIAAGPLTITVPSSAVLPSTSPGGSTSAQLGTVTVNDLRGMATASWTATVTATTFVTGGATAAETIPLTQITYWSGPATATTGTGTFTPGQASPAAAVNLTVPRAVFTLTAGSSVNSAAWNPTLSVAVPAAAVAGTYTATITHSVA
ncbi:MAG TPA: putative Ig domain-containing protein [Streptosporangiaceae bacterium]|nr:putative Ig domain-containing protein [Streptosporangiaceae bacterium]